MMSVMRPLTMKIQALVWLSQCGYCSENHGTVYPMGSLLTQYIPYEEAPEICMNLLPLILSSQTLLQ